MPFHMNLADYLAVYGYDNADPQQRLPQMTEAEQSAVKNLMEQAGSLKKRISHCNNAIYQMIPGRWTPEGSFKKLNKEALREVAKIFAQSGHLSMKKNQYLIQTSDDAAFINGGWLEQYVSNVLEKMHLDPWTNLIVNRQDTQESEGNPVRNEFDAAFLHNGYFYIVECKAGRVSKPGKISDDNGLEIVYKLEAQMRTGGTNTRVILASYQPLSKAVHLRVQKYGDAFTIVEGSELLKLEDKIKKCLK